MKGIIVVLGCGPAGLFATHAAALAGYGVINLSKKRKSDLYGCQYLHRPIPILTTERTPFRVKYELRGTEAQYRAKVYGPDSRVVVSPTDLCGEHDAWDLRATYDQAWEVYGDAVHHTLISGANLQHHLDDVIKNVGDVYRVINTIPAIALCLDPEHTFKAERVWAMGDAPERGQQVPGYVDDFSVVCNGEDSPRWYRAAKVFGYGTVEWPDGSKPPFDGVAAVEKPVGTTCNCWPDVMRVGRYGQWAKGVLSHDAFGEVFESLTGLMPQDEFQR
jgi:hypothetical protein